MPRSPKSKASATGIAKSAAGQARAKARVVSHLKKKAAGRRRSAPAAPGTTPKPKSRATVMRRRSY